MKPIDFNKPLQVDDGIPVRLLASDLNGPFPVVVAIAAPDGDDYTCRFDSNGVAVGGFRHLMNVPEKRTRWLNIYENRCCIHESREEADDRKAYDRVACIQITYHEGEGL